VRKSNYGFTLIELLVSIAVLVGVVLLVSRLFNSATAITTLRTSRTDAESQIRPLFERIAFDFSQMVKRSDADFFGKGTDSPNSPGGAMPGNDRLAFYGLIPGYHLTNVSPSPVSLVAYRVTGQRLERMAKALLWNGASVMDSAIVFFPLTIAGNWPAATNDADDADYELIGPYVFRFEYYYLLRNGALSDQPWDAGAGHSSVNGLEDVAAISVCVAAVDPRSRVLFSQERLAELAGRLNDFTINNPDSGEPTKPGDLLTQWQTALDATTDVPRSAVSAVRIYERYFYLEPGR